jgi:Asp-tRNA(Asn)/Glu-tRNA(Gln) amidotransferase C subunit
VHADVAKVLGYVQAVQAADTTGVAPLVSLTQTRACPTRADTPAAVPVEQALQNAAVLVGTFFAAPKGKTFVAMVEH